MFQHPHTLDHAPARSEFAIDDNVHLVRVSEEYPLHLMNEFNACLIGDMLVYKLGAFISDLNAKLVKVEENRVVMKVGRRRLMPSWSGCEYDRPIEIELTIAPSTDSASLSTARRCHITTCIRPVGWVTNRPGYEQKVRALVRSLRAYFMAD